MPVVELDIGGTPTRVQVGDGYTPDDLDHIAGTLSGSGESAASRAGSYLTHKGSQFIGAAQGVGKDIANLVTGQPYGSGFPGERSGWDTAGDVAQTAAPIVAPELTAAGLGVGTAARAAGADEPTADLANAGTQLVGGLGNAALSAGKAVRGAPAALKTLAQAKYGEAAAGAAKTLSMGTTEGDAFATAISDAADWSGAHPAERAMVKPLLNKLTAPGSAGLTYADLDDAMAGLRKIRGPSYVRGLIDDAAQSLIEGSPAGTARTAAKAAFKASKTSLTRNASFAGRVGIGAVGAGATGKQLAEGKYKQAALTAGGTALGMAGLRYLTPGGIAVAGKAAAGPLARTAVAVGGQVPGLAGDSAPESPASDTAPDTAPAAPEQAPSPTQAIKPLPGPFGRELAAVSSLVGVPAELLHSVMQQESGGNPNAVSHPGPDQVQTPAHGLMQITPGTFASVAPQAAKLLGRKPDPSNPLDNILASGLLWRKYLDRSQGDVGIAAKMYHGGEGTQAWGPRTEQYSRDIASRYAAEGG